jgi:hypothetical protein
MTPEIGACNMVHELYHLYHWGWAYWEENEAHELTAKVYIELEQPRSGSYWRQIQDDSRKYEFPLP